MTTKPDPTDPLLQGLATEASDLAARAALVARQRSSQRKLHQRCSAAVVTVLLVGASMWLLLPKNTSETRIIASNAVPPPDHPMPVVREFVQVRTEGETRLHPPPIPEGLDREQQALVAAVPDLPLLIVRDNGGSKVTRIHVIERE